MTAQILNGLLISQKIRKDLATEIQTIHKSGGRIPGLAVILVGNDYASSIYVQNKQQAAKEIGMLSKSYNLSETTTQDELLDLIHSLNEDKNIDGILVQLPLPKHINTMEILEHIDTNKDVDGFHPMNFGKLAQGNPYLRPCTPYGILYLLKETKINLSGANAIIVGASNIVGKPLAFELLNMNATVTICNKYTKKLEEHVRNADVLISAAGVPNLIKGNWIKFGAIVIDVGMNRLENNVLVGDIEFNAAKERASWITPVPGGVGPMTIAMLLKNTLKASKG